MGKNKVGLYHPQLWEFKSDNRHWVRLYHDMLDSPAFKTLTPEAKLIYLYLKKEYKGIAFNEIKDTVICPYSTISESTGIRRGNIYKRLLELEKFGFISISKSGGLYRQTNHYKFIQNWKSINENQASSLKEEIKEEKASRKAKPGKKVVFISHQI